MVEWERICCAVDFADPSRAAMAQAAELARRFEAELTLVHVHVPPGPVTTDVLASSAGVATVDTREDEVTLAGWRADAERRAGRPARSRLLAGDPAAEIVRHAREERCDLVVIGTHGRTGLARLVLGSVAERVARQSPCPVLVVHDRVLREREDVADEIAQHR